tara:strand:+ start:544 stop:993 length:450 start_codon:yes stop_codon:yes gene_type:complete
MAILDKKRNLKPSIVDRDDAIFIGIDLPFHLSSGPEGYFASTSTTMTAIKNNIRSLMKTETGERLFQPTLGLNLKKYLFEQITPDTELNIQHDISTTISTWLPFVEIQDIVITTDDEDAYKGHTLKISITFFINRNPNALESVTVNIGE